MSFVILKIISNQESVLNNCELIMYSRQVTENISKDNRFSLHTSQHAQLFLY